MPKAKFFCRLPDVLLQNLDIVQDQSDGKGAFQPQGPGELCKRGVVQNPSGDMQKLVSNYKNCLEAVIISRVGVAYMRHLTTNSSHLFMKLLHKLCINSI